MTDRRVHREARAGPVRRRRPAGGVRAALTTSSALLALRTHAAPHLATPPTPLGFHPRAFRRDAAPAAAHTGWGQTAPARRGEDGARRVGAVRRTDAPTPSRHAGGHRQDVGLCRVQHGFVRPRGCIGIATKRRSTTYLRPLADERLSCVSRKRPAATGDARR